MNHAAYTFRGTTQSLCPQCLEVVPAKIITRGPRVYFRKRCPTCGDREDYVCSDISWYDRLETMLPSKLPLDYGTQPRRGCPWDCGLCTEHEQHTCIGLLEITSSCNLECPLCYASSGPVGRHLPIEACRRAIDRLVEVEGRPEVLQLSGGEPTIHPEFESILEYACRQPIDYVMINTNGVRLAHDPEFVQRVADRHERVEIYFQLDGLKASVTRQLRGAELLDIKMRALEAIGATRLNVTLAVTMQGGVNDDEIGPLIDFAAERPWITGISFQPATYSGRHVLPEQLDDRITFPDVIRGAEVQTGGRLSADDFVPLPCAHPNCHQISLVYRSSQGLVPLNRFIDADRNLDLLANGIVLTRKRGGDLIRQWLNRQTCCGGGCGTPAPDALHQPAGNGRRSREDGGAAESQRLDDQTRRVRDEFVRRALSGQLGARDLLRITITSFLDAYNFDVRRLMKCCTHHVLPSGHLVPFCAYNVLYRTGKAQLPPLAKAVNPAPSCR